MKLKKTFQTISLVLLLNSCVEPYEAKTETFEDVLVVQALITNEIKHQEIILSRSFRFEDENASFESNAVVKVYENNQNEYLFEETSPGKYISTTVFGALPNQDYQLSIKTNSGKSYLSEPTKLIESNLTNDLKVYRETNLDSINGMALYIDSYDPLGNSGYYKFEYEETYKIIAPNWYFFDLIAAPDERDGLSVDYRTQEERVCFKTEYSNEIILKNSNEFGEDRLNPFLIRFVNSDNYILTHRYSLLVKQYVLSRDAYMFYKTLKDFSDSESLFSENQPGFVNGNIYSEDNSNEKVVGLFNVSMVYSKRIFFNFTDYYEWFEVPDYYIDCIITSPSLEATPTQSMSLWEMVKNNMVKFQIENDAPKPGESAYYVVPRVCGDCTALGSNIVPDFWVD